MDKFNILFLITARGGSKGVPRKNIRELDGIPLVGYKIRAAQRCGYSGRIIVSTDDEEIAKVSKKWGGEVPFLRPDYLASDTASSMDVVEHAMKWVLDNDKTKYSYICLLEPSSPFTTPMDLNKALKQLISSKADTLLGVKEVDVNTVFIHELDSKGGLSLFYNAIKNLKNVRRQDQKKQYTMNGCMYIARWDYFATNKTFHSENSLAYIMDDEHSIEIDTMSNYNYANYVVKNGIVNTEPWK